MGLFPRTVAVAFAIGLGILVLSLTGVISSLDAWFFDRLILMAPSAPISSERVLVIESDRALEIPEILDLAEKLSSNGARLTAFVQDSGAAVDEATEATLRQFNAIVSPGCRGETESEISNACPPQDGIWRGVSMKSGRGEPPSPSTTDAVAEELNLTPLPLGYHLDFRVRRDGIQRIEAGRVLGGDLAQSLVDGKVVLVGNRAHAGAMITTPVHRGEEALAPLLFQAAVIDALLRNGIVQIAQPLFQWGAAILLVGVLGTIAWWWNFDRALWLAGGGIVLAVAGAWIALWAFQWWLPPTKAAVLLGIGGVTAASSRGAIRTKALRRTLRHLAVDVQERAEKGGGFLTSPSPWALIESTLGQSFSFDTGFVLRADEKSRGLEAVTESGKAVCEQLFAISSLRLDQEPFATALRSSVETRLEDNLVVLPIRSRTQVFGFWIFKPPEKSSIDQAIAYADRLAVMLERRDEWRARAHPHQLEVHDAASLRIQPLHSQLEGSIDLLDRGRRILAEALDCSREAVLVFDPFGKLAHVSRRSVEMLGSAGIEFTESPPSVLLEKLTDANTDEIRRALRFVALQRGETTFKVTKTPAAGREFFIHLRALTETAGSTGDDDQELPGLVVLIQDVTQIARAALLKDEFMEHIYFQLNNDFETIVAASALFSDPRIEAADRDELLATINEKIDEAAQRIQATRAHLHTEFTPVAVECYPIRFEPVFSAARAAVAAEVESHHLTIDTSISDYLKLVLAASKPLEDLLRAILLTLVHDAREESRITVGAEQQETELTVSMTNEGFGMPQEKLEPYIHEGAGGHETLETIGAGLITVGGWGGNLTLRSEVGVGMAFELKLISVI